MEKVSYIVTAKKTGAAFQVTYNTEGCLESVVFLNNFSAAQMTYFQQSLLGQIMLDDTVLRERDAAWLPFFKIEDVRTDVSFACFWNVFNNKVGKKGRAQQLWELLPDTDKKMALLYIKKYKAWLLQNPSVQMLYPETYLSQKRWEND